MADGPQLRPLRPGEGGHGGEGGCGEGTALPAALARTAGWGVGVGGDDGFLGRFGGDLPAFKARSARELREAPSGEEVCPRRRAVRIHGNGCSAARP